MFIHVSRAVIMHADIQYILDKFIAIFFTNSMTNAPCYCTAERALLTLLVRGHLPPPAPCFDPDTNCISLKLFARLLRTPNAPVTCSFY